MRNADTITISLPPEIGTPTKSELAAIRKGRAEFERGEYMTLDQLHDELSAARNQSR